MIKNNKCWLCNKTKLDDYNAIFITSRKMKKNKGLQSIGNIILCKNCYKTLKNIVSIMQKQSGSRFDVNKKCL